MALIRDYVKDEEKQIEAVKEVIASSTNISSLLFWGAINHYNGIDYEIRGKYTDEKNTNCAAALAIMENCGDAIAKNFADNKNISKLAGDAWFAALNLNKSGNKISVEKYKEKIKKCGPEYEKKLLEAEVNELEKANEVFSKKGSKIALIIASGFFIFAILEWFAPIFEDANMEFWTWIFMAIPVLCILVNGYDVLFGSNKKVSANQKAIEAKKKELENLKTKE